MNDGWFFRVFRCSFLLVASFDMEVPDHLQEQFVDAGVVGQFGMEGCDEHVSLAGCNGFAIDAGKNLDLRTGLLDVGSADESHGHAADARKLGFRVEAPQLTAVGVATSRDVHHTEVVAVEHDEARTGSEHRKSVENGLPERLEQAFVLHNAHHGRALAAGDSQTSPLDPLQTSPRGGFLPRKTLPLGGDGEGSRGPAYFPLSAISN